MAASDAELTHNQLYGWLRDRLPGYMVPAAYVRIEKLPVLPNGKLDRRSLPEPDAGSYSGQGYEEPQGEIEQRIAAIWAEVLKLPPERIGRHDNFFAVGGQSMTAVQILAGLTQFNIEISIAVFFATTSLKELGQVVQAIDIRTNRGEPEALAMTENLSEQEADRLTALLTTEDSAKDSYPAAGPTTAASPRERLLRLLRSQGPSKSIPRIQPRPASSTAPLSFSQQRVWAFEKSRQGHTGYHIPLAVRLLGGVNMSALHSAVAKLTQRHEMLRTTFPMEANGPIQKIAESINIHVHSLDLSCEDGSKHKRLARSFIQREMKRPFNLETGPLLRVNLIHLDAEEDILLLIVHHIAADGLSINLLVQELAVFYGATLLGDEHPLTPLTLQYGDYAFWQREHLEKSPLLEEQEAYWLRNLKGAPLTTEMPAIKPRPPRPLRRARRFYSQIPSLISGGLAAVAERREATTFMSLLAAFHVLIYSRTAQQDQIIGVQFANRPDAALGSVIGTFHNFLPIRGHVDPSSTFSQWLDSVRKTTLAASVNQDVPFSRLVEALKLSSSGNKAPLTQISLTQVDAGLAGEALPGLTIEPFSLEDGYMAIFDLRIILQVADDRIIVIWEYATDLFDKAAITQFADQYTHLLEQIVADPNVQLGTLRSTMNGFSGTT